MVPKPGHGLEGCYKRPRGGSGLAVYQFKPDGSGAAHAWPPGALGFTVSYFRYYAVGDDFVIDALPFEVFAVDAQGLRVVPSGERWAAVDCAIDQID